MSDAADWIEIHTALAVLAQAQDDRDWEAVAAAYLPDATYAHPGGVLDGVGAIVDRTRTALHHLDACQHVVGSVVVTVGGVAASSRAQFQAMHVRAATPGGDLYEIGGRYEDAWVRTEHGWRIARRSQTYSWRRGNRDVVVPSPDEGGTP